MLFLRVSERKNQRFFPAGPFFLVLHMIVYQSALFQENSPTLKNFWLRACKRFNIAHSITYRTYLTHLVLGIIINLLYLNEIYLAILYIQTCSVG